MSRETQLWYWLLFRSELPTSRAKDLLDRWTEAGQTLSDVLRGLPRGAAQFGLKTEEARQLQPPNKLPDINAIRWDESRYPQGLQRLPLKLRPALLFVEGPEALLERQVVTLPPAPIAEAEREAAREALSLLLGESLLPAAVQGSDQAALLLVEMSHAEGDVLLMARAGLDQIERSEAARRLLANERLLLVSPLPPGTPPNPKWAAVLREVEAAMADRCLLTTARPPVARFLSTHPEIPLLWLHTGVGKAQVPDHAEHAKEPATLLTWLAGEAQPEQSLQAQPAPSLADAARPLGEAPPDEPPPTPEETLQILQKGGDVPPALRARLMGEAPDES